MDEASMASFNVSLKLDVEKIDEWIELNSLKFKTKSIYKSIYKKLDGLTFVFPELVEPLQKFKHDAKI
jgi:hypothetical protein